MLCLFSSFFFILILPVNFLFIIIIIIIFPFFLFFSHTSCTPFPTNIPPNPQCRRIILEYEARCTKLKLELKDTGKAG